MNNQLCSISLLSKFCVQHQSCRLEPSCWNNLTTLISTAIFPYINSKVVYEIQGKLVFAKNNVVWAIKQ